MRLNRLLIIFYFSITSTVFSEQKWQRGIFRVNSNISSGAESIETVTEKACKKNLDFVVFSDQFLVRAEYGLPPFRNIFKFSKERGSISTFGIENYLKKIDEVDRKYRGITLIPGVDIAPHYYWTGNPNKKNLTVNQFSEQLTVFGNGDPEFYRNLPVIHNEQFSFSFVELLADLSPLILSLVGIFIFLCKRKPYYSDMQGNRYYSGGKIARIAAGILTILGIIWCLDKKPFRNNLEFDQYRRYGVVPYQQVIDYVRKQGGSNAGIIWSAPEIKMKDNIAGISLITLPYLSDIENTLNHNGMAGIYADVSHAHEAGKTFDKLLSEYCSGRRKTRPVMTGELDYHGRSPIDMIQTVVQTEKADRESITKSLIEGKSYAVTENNGKEIIITHASLDCGEKSVGLGETIQIKAKNQPVLKITGRTEGVEKNVSGIVTVIFDGREILSETTDLKSFSLNYEISFEDMENLPFHYLRFYIKTGGSGWVISNPIFVKIAD